MKRSRPLPEYPRRIRRNRAGFVPFHDDGEYDVTLWTIWARSDSGDERRATYDDVKRATRRRKR